MRVGLLLLALVGCGSEPACEQPSDVLVAGEPPLVCADVDGTERYIELLAGRSIATADRRQLRKGLQKRFRRDPAATRAQLQATEAVVSELEATVGLDAARLRSESVYQAHVGQGPFGDADDRIATVREAAVAVWKVSDAERLALSEMDIEGWILYASLCREVQAASPLRLSVADRVSIYRELEDRFELASRDEKIALAAMGAFWVSLSEAWAVASYEEQQRWVRAAPLPPPMLATSKGYLAAIVEGPVASHASLLHDALGPVHLSVVQ